MLSRRAFLQASLSVSAVPLLSSLAAARELDAPVKILVLAEGVCSDSSLFARIVGARQLGADPSAQLLELEATLATGEFDAVFGLTRNSNQFLIEQYAQAQRYYPSFKGVHEYSERGLAHRLNGDHEVVARLAVRLEKSPTQWAAAVADSADLICQSCAPTMSRMVHAGLQRPVDSPGYLVSWMLRRAV